MKVALLVVDMQNIFLQSRTEEMKVEVACESINYVADLLRKHHHLVIHIQDMEEATETNTELMAIIPEINVDPKDIMVSKVFSNAFWQTDLEQILRRNEIGLVIVAGFAAEHCVLFTYNGAIERGFPSVLLQNGIVSTKPNAVSDAYRDRNLISHPVIQYMVEASAR